MAAPSYDEFARVIRSRLAGVPEEDLRSAYTARFGRDAVPVAGPTFEEFSGVVRSRMPDVSDEDLAAAYRARFGVGMGTTLKRAAISGAAETPRLLGGLMQLPRQFSDDPQGVGLAQGLGVVGDTLRDIARDTQQANLPSAEQQNLPWYSPRKIARQVTEIGTGMAPQLAAGYTLGPAVTAGRVGAAIGTTIGASMAGAQEGLGEYERLLAEGVPESEARRRGWMFGVAVAPLNAIPLARIFSRTPGRILTGVAEAVTEAAEEPVSAALGGASLPEMGQAFVSGLREVGAPAFLLGAAFGATGPTRSSRAALEEFRKRLGDAEAGGGGPDREAYAAAVENLMRSRPPDAPRLPPPFGRPDWYVDPAGQTGTTPNIPVPGAPLLPAPAVGGFEVTPEGEARPRSQADMESLARRRAELGLEPARIPIEPDAPAAEATGAAAAPATPQTPSRQAPLLPQAEARAAGARTKTGPTPARPVRVQGQTEQRVWTARGTPVDTGFAVVEADDLITSDKPAFPPALQPRERDRRMGSQEQIASILAQFQPERLGASTEADRGAPIIGPDGLVESGNGRVMALRRLYQSPQDPRTQAYRAFIEQQTGQSTEGMRAPVLVRRRLTEVADRRAFAIEANEAATARMSPGEQARADADLITPDSMRGFAPDQDGQIDLTNAALPFVRDFLRALPAGERAGLLDRAGRVSAAGVARMRGAVLARAYGGSRESDDAVTRVLEATEGEAQTLTQALVNVAPRFLQLRAAIDAGQVQPATDIGPQLAEAVELVRSLGGKSGVNNWLKQTDLATPRNPIIETLLQGFYGVTAKGIGRLRPRSAIESWLSGYVDDAMTYRMEAPGGSLFGEEAPIPQADPAELLNARREGLIDATETAETTGSLLPAGGARLEPGARGGGTRGRGAATGGTAGEAAGAPAPAGDEPAAGIEPERNGNLSAGVEEGASVYAMPRAYRRSVDNPTEYVKPDRADLTEIADDLVSLPDVAALEEYFAFERMIARERYATDDAAFDERGARDAATVDALERARIELIATLEADPVLRDLVEGASRLPPVAHDAPRRAIYNRLRELIWPSESVAPRIVEERRARYGVPNERQLKLFYDNVETRPGTTGAQRDRGLRGLRALFHRDKALGATVLGSAFWRGWRSGRGVELIGKTARTPRELALIAQILRSQDFETARWFFTKAGKIVGHVAVSSRMPGFVTFAGPKANRRRHTAFYAGDQSLGYQMNRETEAGWNQLIDTIKAEGKRLGADGYWMLHNHPSGRARPSEPDVAVTRFTSSQLSASGLDFKGHVVIDSNEYGFIDPVTHDVSVSPVEQRAQEPELPHDLLGQRIDSPLAMTRIASQLTQRKGWATVIVTHNNQKIALVTEMPSALLQSQTKLEELKVAARLRRLWRRGAGGTTVSPSYMVFVVADDVSGLGQWLQRGLLTDAIGSDGVALSRYAANVADRSLVHRWQYLEGTSPHTAEEPRATYYSVALEALLALPPNIKVNADTAVKTLKGRGVTDEEIDWLDIRGYIARQNGRPVSHSELAQWVAANSLTVTERVLGPDYDAAFRADAAALWNDIVAHYNGEPPLGMYEAFQRPANLRDFELIERLPGELYERVERLRVRIPISDVRASTSFARWRVPGFKRGNMPLDQGGEKYQELLLQLPTRAPYPMSMGAEPDSFTQGHFGFWPNVVAHARVDERLTADNRPILFVQELQSDWHGAGRKHGYRKRWSREELDRLTLDPRVGDQDWFVRDENGELVDRLPGALLDAPSALIQARRRLRTGTNAYAEAAAVADAPFKDTWRYLAMKALVRWAATQGYSEMAFATGRHQMRTYPYLMNKVQYMDVGRNGDYFSVRGWNARPHAALRDRMDIKFEEDMLTEDDVHAMLGEERFRQLMAMRDTEGWADLEKRMFTFDFGEPKPVGGETLRNAYDIVVPQMVRKFAARHGGKIRTEQLRFPPEKRNEVKLPKPPKSIQRTRRLSTGERVQEDTVIVLEITDALRDKALNRGFPLYGMEPRGRYESTIDMFGSPEPSPTAEAAARAPVSQSAPRRPEEQGDMFAGADDAGGGQGGLSGSDRAASELVDDILPRVERGAEGRSDEGPRGGTDAPTGSVQSSEGRVEGSIAAEDDEAWGGRGVREQRAGYGTGAGPASAAPRPDKVDLGGGEYSQGEWGGLSGSEYRVLTEVMAGLDEAVAGQRGGRGPRTWTATEQAALARIRERVGLDVGALLSREVGSAINATQLEEYGIVLASATREVDRIARRAAETGNREDLVALEVARERLGLLLAPTMGYHTEAGRALNIIKKQKRTVDTARRVLEMMGDGRELVLEDFARQVAKASSLDQVAGVAKASYTPDWFDKFFEYWINGLLSGPTTHAVNITSNTIYRAIEEAAALAGAAVTPNYDARRVAARVSTIPAAVMVGAKNAGRAFVTEEPQLTMGGKIEAHPKAIPGQLGRTVRIPGRALIAEDEFFKSLGFHAELADLAMGEAIAAAPNDPMPMYHQIMGSVMQRKDLIEKARAAAEHGTFTTALGPLGQVGTFYLNKSRVGRLIVPFIRTPVNIIKAAIEYTPATLAKQETRRLLMGEGDARDVAMLRGRLLLGSSFMIAAIALAQAGLLSGGGPDDESERELLRRQGWQPYAIRVGDQWVKYNRIDPLGTLLGVAASMYELGMAAPDADVDKLAAMTLTAFMQNLGDKTFLSGVVDFAEAVSDPQRYLERWAYRMAGSVVPNAASQVGRQMDPYSREAEGVLDAVRERIPVARTALARRMDIAGEPLRSSATIGVPANVTTAKPDALADAMLRLGLRKSRPDRKIRGAELSAADYESYSAYMGQVRWAQLTPLVNSPQFRSLMTADPERARALLNQSWERVSDAARLSWVYRNPRVMGQIAGAQRTPKAKPSRFVE